MKSRKSQNQKSTAPLAKKIESIERRLIKADARHAWLKSNNMKQECVVLTDFHILGATVVTGTTTTALSQLAFLNANAFKYASTSGNLGAKIPQTAIWDEYAAMYEFYMVERIELEYVPSFVTVETTATGVQDSALYPTCGTHCPDSFNQTLYAPVGNLTDLQTIVSVIAAKKGARVIDGRSKMQITSDVSNTLLLKQSAPMLRTNGSAAAREKYADEAGGVVIVPSRQGIDRIPFGMVRYRVHYRFAGQIIPGIGQNKAPQEKAPVMTIAQLKAILQERLISEAIESTSMM